MIINKKEIPSLLVIVIMPLIYLYYGSKFSGPAYLSDEIGYLAKAAFLGGYTVDGASSWHAGYSFLLAPVFFFFDSANTIWFSAIVVNCFLWGGFFYLVSIASYVVWINFMEDTSPCTVSNGFLSDMDNKIRLCFCHKCDRLHVSLLRDNLDKMAS